MSLRIIGGTFKGRRLQTPPGLHTRPLTDRIKQSLFDWLGGRCDDWRVCDCCAGAGSFGLEALSRGAREVHCCEPDPAAFSCLLANHRQLGQPASCHLHRRAFQPVLAALRDLDCCFCDPPFPWYAGPDPQLQELLSASAAAIHADGCIIIRGERGRDLPTLPESLQERERRHYGRSWLALLQRR